MLKHWTDFLLASACSITLYCTFVYFVVLFISGIAFPLIQLFSSRPPDSAAYVVITGIFLILFLLFLVSVFCILLLGWGRCLRLTEYPDFRFRSPCFIPFEPLLLLLTLWHVSWRRGRLAFSLFLIGGALLFLSYAGSIYWLVFLISGNFYDGIAGVIDTIPGSYFEKVRIPYCYLFGQLVCYCLFLWFLSFQILVPMLVKRKGFRVYYPVWALVCSFLMTTVSAYAMIWYYDAKVELRAQELRSMRIPVCAADLKEPYFHGMKPDPAWIALVNRKNPPERELFSHPLLVKKKTIWSVADCNILDSELKKHENFLQECDAVFSRTPVKYEVEYDINMAVGFLLPHLGYYRDTARLYRVRIRVALQKHDLLEVLRLYGHFNNLLDSVADENFLIGGLVYYACLDIWKEAIMDMMSSGLLTENDLKCIGEDAVKRELILPEIGKRTLLSDAALIDVCDYIINPFKNLCSFIRWRNPVFAFAYCKFREEQLFMMDFWRKVADDMNAPGWEPLNHDTFLAQADRAGLAFYGLRFFPVMLLPALNVSWKRVMVAVVHLRQVRIACEIELFRRKYGRLPKILDELNMREMPLDPFSKRPFTYTCGMIELGFKSSEGSVRGYRLYGVGRNNKPYPPGADLIVFEPGSYVPAPKSDCLEDGLTEGVK